MPERLPTPKGWATTTLGAIAEPSRERASPLEAPALRYVGLEHIEPHSMKLLGHGYAHETRSSSVRFSRGDILYGKMRPYLNKVWVAEFDGVCSAEFLVFKSHEGLNSQFLALRLNSEDFVTFANRQVSGERPRVDFEKLSRFPILLPPLAEQEKIVVKLTASLSRVGRAKTATLRAHDRLRLYRTAVLDSAVTGQLTNVWRESRFREGEIGTEDGQDYLRRLLVARRAAWEQAELKRLHQIGKNPQDSNWKSRYPEPRTPITEGLPELPSTWLWATLEQVSTRVTVGYVGEMKNEYVNKGIPFLRSQNVRPNRFEPEGIVFIGEEFHAKLAKSKITPGDVVVVRSGVGVGTTCVIPESLGEANCSDLVLIQSPLIEPRFISFYMNSAARSHVAMGKVGVAQPHFNTASVASLAVPLPEVHEQAEIVREVDLRFAAADRLATTLEQQLVRADATRQSFLREAFVGRLVPQDPSDEPASQLLGRIRIERDAEHQTPKGKRMSKLKSKTKAIGRQSLLTILKEKGRPMTPEELFNESGHSQESVDQFFAELRQLTAAPAKIVEERDGGATSLLKAVS
jgi:type I restriction enzyme, S subunit